MPNVSVARVSTERVMEHFKDGKLKRLEVHMLPRDQLGVLKGLRAAIAYSFNYCKQSPKRLDLFIDVMTFAVKYASIYRNYDKKIKEEMVQGAVTPATIGTVSLLNKVR